MYSLDNRHKFARPAWARPGFAMFAKKAETEGGDDDDLNDDDPDDDDPDDEDDDDDPDEGKSEDELRAELKAVRESLSKASGSGKSKRDKIKRLTQELEAAKAGKPAAKPKGKDGEGDDDKVDADAIAEAARAEVRAEAKKTRIADKAELALARAGVDEAKLAKAVKLIDLDDLDLDDDGKLDGIDEVLDELKREWPELFGPKSRKRKSVAGDSDRDGDAARSKKANSASEQQARQLTGRGGRR